MNKMKKKIVLCLLLTVVFLIPTSAVNNQVTNDEAILLEDSDVNENAQYETKNTIISLSKPQIQDINNDYLQVKIKEANSYLSEPGRPLLPVICKVFTFPLGTQIVDVNVDYQTTSYTLKKQIVPCSQPRIPTDSKNDKTNVVIMDDTVYNSHKLYPEKPYFIHKGAGLQGGEHVLFLTVKIIPQYIQAECTLHSPQKVEITIKYTLPETLLFTADAYDMAIIAPEQFSSDLQPLIDHKNNYGVRTFLKTTEEIYAEYEGRDNAEQIKYFIKDTIENFGIRYILLIGDVDLVPMRKSYVTVITREIIWKGILTDLYYADIYNSTGGFSSWDSNGNDAFGECRFNFFSGNGKIDIIDKVDLYPDLRIGRLPCSNEDEVHIVSNKIIAYETETYGDEWFNRIILMSGDTSPEQQVILEGEWLHEEYISPEMEKHGFNPVKLYTSLNTFNPEAINQEVTSGAGFVSYAGHGNTNVIATYPPQETSSISYSIQDISGMNNGGKLPVFFLDACLTGKLDYNIFDRGIFILFPFSIIKILLENIFDTKIYPCFAWSLIKHQIGGGVAVIAASQPSWDGFVYNDEGIEIIFGSALLHRYFFEGYEVGTTLSNMSVRAQNSYINLIANQDGLMWDRNTLDEFNLIGDPSLKIGGYP